MTNEKDKILSDTELSNNIKPSLHFLNKGTFGYIFRDGNFIYKISHISDDETIIKNNIVEACFMNGRIHDKNEDNLNSIIQGDVKIRKVGEFFKRYNLLRKDSNIVKKYFRDDKENILIIKMNKYKSDLYEDIKNKKIVLNYKNLIRIFKKLCYGLLVFHDNDFLHGDFKTCNILTNDDDIAIIDYGGLKLKNNPIYNLTCTLTYRCPEDLRREYSKEIVTNFNTKSDVWGLGLVLSEVILGYNKIYKVYYRFKSFEMKEYNLDRKLLKWFENNKIDIINEINEIDVNIENDEKMTNLLNKINIMLETSEEKRPDDIRKIYEEITGEKINKNYKKEYNYDYTSILNEYYLGELKEYEDIFYKIRRKCYLWLIEFGRKFNYIDSIPLAIDVSDRYFIRNLKNMGIEKDSINYELFERLILCILMLSQCFIYGQVIYFEKIADMFMIDTKETDNIIKYINEIISNILEQLDFDIFRPFYDKNINIKDEYDRKEKLYKKMVDYISSDKIGIKPEDYYE